MCEILCDNFTMYSTTLVHLTSCERSRVGLRQGFFGYCKTTCQNCHNSISSSGPLHLMPQGRTPVSLGISLSIKRTTELRPHFHCARLGSLPHSGDQICIVSPSFSPRCGAALIEPRALAGSCYSPSRSFLGCSKVRSGTTATSRLRLLCQ